MGDGSRRRGRYIAPKTRKKILALIEEAVAGGCRKEVACEDLGISARTVLRWESQDDLIDGRTKRTFEPANKYSQEERDEILKLINSAEFRDLPPSQIVPILLDRGEFHASESTMYRILHENKMMAHRGRRRSRRKVRRPRSFKASAPNQVWTWDITYLPASTRGKSHYLYMIMDIFSRKIVGWAVHEKQQDELSALAFGRAVSAEGAEAGLVLHSDNGGPMKGATMMAKMQELGVISSFSRPATSNDNPFSESLFRTLKYRPDFPDQCFSSLQDAGNWVDRFVSWYNNEHRHSALKFITPNQRHSGQWEGIMASRREILERAKAKSPERWSRHTRNWDLPRDVELNPPKHKTSPQASQTRPKRIRIPTEALDRAQAEKKNHPGHSYYRIARFFFVAVLDRSGVALKCQQTGGEALPLHQSSPSACVFTSATVPDLSRMGGAVTGQG